jgi:hypothetical protein
MSAFGGNALAAVRHPLDEHKPLVLIRHFGNACEGSQARVYEFARHSWEPFLSQISENLKIRPE